MEQGEARACIVCGEQKTDGIQVVHAFICHTCESEMVHTPVEDMRYPFFVQQLKQIWVRFDT